MKTACKFLDWDYLRCHGRLASSGRSLFRARHQKALGYLLLLPLVNPSLLWSLKKKQPRFQLLRYQSLHVVLKLCLTRTMKVANHLCGQEPLLAGLGSSKEADLNRWWASTSSIRYAWMTGKVPLTSFVMRVGFGHQRLH